MVRVLLAALVVTPAAFAKPRIVNPGRGVCQSKTVQNLQAESSVALAYTFVDAKGQAIKSFDYCSGSIARVGSSQKLKIVSAAHCASSCLRQAPGGLLAPGSTDPACKRIPPFPPGAVGMRITARIGSSDKTVDVTSIAGPTLKFNAADKEESFRRDDMVFLDGNAGELEKAVKSAFRGRTPNFAEVCSPAMAKEDVRDSVVIGYGVTNNGQRSPVPLCGEQKINTIQNGIVSMEPYKAAATLEASPSNACPGDSGGGLWFVPKSGGAPCLAGAVSGPLSAGQPTKPGDKPITAVESCTKDGVVVVYSSVYQQPGLVDSYVNQAAGAASDAATTH